MHKYLSNKGNFNDIAFCIMKMWMSATSKIRAMEIRKIKEKKSILLISFK